MPWNVLLPAGALLACLLLPPSMLAGRARCRMDGCVPLLPAHKPLTVAVEDKAARLCPICRFVC